MRADTEGKDKMMRRTRIAAATVMAAAGFLGAVATPASAGTTHKLVHNFNSGGTVWMKVKVDKGKPKFVKDIRLSGLEMSCPDPNPVLNPIGTHQDSGREEFPGKIRVKAGTKPPEYSKVLINDAMSQLDVTGTLRKKGKLSTVRMALTQVAGSGPCFWGSTGFEASWVHGAQTALAGGESGDSTPPDLQLSGKKTQELGNAVKVKASCGDEACQAGSRSAKLTNLGVADQRFPNGDPKGPILKEGLGRAKADLRPGETTTLKLQLNRNSRKAAGKALAEGRNVHAKVIIEATTHPDTAGNVATAKRTIRLVK